MKFVCTAFIIFVLSLASGATENRFSGARSLALSHATVALGGSEALFHNQAAIGFSNRISLAMAYESRFAMKEYALMSLGAVIPFKPVVVGLSFYQFGNSVYRENKTGLVLARNFGEKFSMGLQFDFFSEKIPENREAFTAVTVELGFLYKLNEKITGGIHIFNPVKSALHTPVGKIELPVNVRIGGIWHIKSDLFLVAEIEKQKSRPLKLKAGVEYSPLNSVSFRLGISDGPFMPSGGVGFHFGKFLFDIGTAYYQYLGFSPSASFVFVL
ncbi:MAG: hypothetical protein FWG22_00080 [Prolixibacteraceae bacterium]|nr:hypothetical protein [Prolixibacteraceae bacterium]